MTVCSVFLDTAFETAHENMAFDDHLFSKLDADSSQRFFRFYTWKNPGLTFSYNKRLPTSLASIDHSQRVSGGGIVFHSPGDIVFSITARLDDLYFPRRFKDKVSFVSEKLTQVIQHTTGYSLDTSIESSEKNILFCNAYPNPYERYFEGHKVLAFAQRRLRSAFMVQGVIHCYSNFDHFSDYPDFSRYFTRGFYRDLNLDLSSFKAFL